MNAARNPLATWAAKAAEFDLFLIIRTLVPSGKDSIDTGEQIVGYPVREVDPADCVGGSKLGDQTRISHEIETLDHHDRNTVAFDKVDEIALQKSHGAAADRHPSHRVGLCGIDAGRGHRVVAGRKQLHNPPGAQHGGREGQDDDPRAPPKNRENLKWGHEFCLAFNLKEALGHKNQIHRLDLIVERNGSSYEATVRLTALHLKSPN